jgi:GNAT superfamily N-acetyltransferase
VKAGDREEWIAMWDGFVSAKPSEPGERGLGELNWARLMGSERPLRCIVAVGPDGHLLGFVLFSLICWSWSSKPVCYLLDVFVRPDARGFGHGRRLMEHMGRTAVRGLA